MSKKVDLNARQKSNASAKIRNHHSFFSERTNLNAKINSNGGSPMASDNIHAEVNNHIGEEASLKDVVVKFPKPMKVFIAIAAIGIIAFAFLLTYASLFISDDDSSSGGSSSSSIYSLSSGRLANVGYYEPKCKNITVVEVDKNNGYAPTGNNKTYNLDDYVAGVVYQEVGGFQNIEVFRAFAIASRTFVLNQATNCSLENSVRKQTFTYVPENTNNASKLAYQAAKETSGVVMMRNNSVYLAHYDAFACIDQNDKNYVLMQRNQEVPV